MAERAITVRIIGDPTSLERAFGKAAVAADTFEKKLSRAGASATRVGSTLTRDVTLPLAAIGVASVRSAQQFDLLISRMVGLGGVTEKQSQKFRQFILDLAPKVGKGPDELANGLYQIVSAGVKGQRALEALTVSAKASAAGLGDTATVADAVTSAMNAYAKSGLTAKQAADVLSATVRDGKGEAASFAPVLGKVVSVAAQLGVSFDQVGGALAQMTKLGVPAEDAATQLSATFSGLLKTTPKAEKALEAMGLSAAGLRQELRDKGLLATLQTLNEKTRGSTVAMSEAFPNVRALRGVLQLVGTAASGTAKTFEDVKNSTNSLATAWRAYTKTDAYQMNKSLAQTKAALIELGGTLAPIVDAFARDLAKVAAKYEALSPPQKEFITKLAEMAAVAGPLVLVTGRLLTMAATLAKLRVALGLLPVAAAESAAGTNAALATLGTGAAARGIGILASLSKVAGLAAKGFAVGGAGVETQSNQPPGSVAVGKGLYVDPKTGHYVTMFNGQVIVGPKAPAGTVTGGGANSGSAAAGSPGRSGAGTGYAGGKVTGRTGPITAGLAALEAFAGGRVNDDAATSGHATNSYHYRGEAADLAPDPGVWARLYANRAAFAELFGPWGLYHYGVQFYDAALQRQHMDHIHVAYTGGPQAISKMLAPGGGSSAAAAAAGGGAGSSYDPLAAQKKAAAAKKAAGAALLPGSIQIALSRAQGTTTLSDDEKALQTAIAYLKSHETTKNKVAVEKELGQLEKRLNEVHKAIGDNLKKAADAMKAKLQPLRDAASAAVSQAFTTYANKITAVFDAQTQAMIAAAGKKFFQGGQTPLEKQLADMQASDQLQSLQDAVNQASTPEERAAAQRQLDEYNLAAAAAAERAQADQAYADEVARIQRERSLEEEKLNDKLAAFGANLADGKAKLSDLNGILAPFGINLSDVGADADSLAYSFSGLSAAVKDLAEVISRITGKPVDLGTGSTGGSGTTAAAARAAARSRSIVGGAPFVALAAGGIVTQPTLSLVGESGPEAVIPLNRLGGGEYVLHNVIELDGKVVYDNWKHRAARDANRNGTTGIR